MQNHIYLQRAVKVVKSCGVRRFPSFKAPKEVFGHLDPGFSFDSSGWTELMRSLKLLSGGGKPLHASYLEHA